MKIVNIKFLRSKRNLLRGNKFKLFKYSIKYHTYYSSFKIKNYDRNKQIYKLA
jgi:hypothetical protein